jgi:hypothetical protein
LTHLFTLEPESAAISAIFLDKSQADEERTEKSEDAGEASPEFVKLGNGERENIDVR